MRHASRLAFLLLCGCATMPGPVRHGDGAAEVGAAIAAAWRDHIHAAQRKDQAGVIALYTDDAVYAVAGQDELRGKPAIATMEARGMATGDVIAALHRTEALRVDGGLAYELGTVEGDVRPAGSAARHMVFHYLAVWQRHEGGAWRIARLFGHAERQ